MHIRFVRLFIKQEYIEAFKEATLINRSQTILEEGVLMFELFQEKENENIFILQEIYTSDKARLSHFDTEQFKTWKGKVEKMFARPLESIQYDNISDLNCLKKL